jgi:hypothetical protein
MIATLTTNHKIPKKETLLSKTLRFGVLRGLPHYTKARFTLGVRAKKNLGPTLSIFGLQIGPKGYKLASQI